MQKYEDILTGKVMSYDSWIDEIAGVFVAEGLDDDRPFVEPIRMIAEMVREGELEPLC